MGGDAEPSKVDVAGDARQPRRGPAAAELSLYQNVVKEAGEEAGIPEEIARRAKSVGVCSYRGVDEWGQLKNDVLFCYDLELPWDFEPVAVDGEVEGFDRWDLDRRRRRREGREQRDRRVHPRTSPTAT